MSAILDEYREVARRLNERIAQLAPELLPRGYREGWYWRVGSVAGEEGQSLAVRLRGDKQGRWFDYGAAKGGDALDLIAGVRFNDDKPEAFQWARDWLNLPEIKRAPPATRRPSRSTGYIDSVRRIWREARRLQRGDPVDRYLQDRGIHLAELGRAPKALRFHAALWNSQTKKCWPAMVAAITSPLGELVAVHCTWLWADAIVVTKAPIPDRHGPSGGAKRTLGTYRGCCIHLWRGASGLRWEEMPDDEICMVGEGIEDTLSAVLNRSAWRAVVAVSLSSMLVLDLPPEIATVVILGQNDNRGSDADQLLRRVIKRWVDQGREVRVARPPAFLKDWNDLAQWCRKKNVSIAWADWQEGEDGRRAGRNGGSQP
jgi:hypothetical protein